MRNLIGLGVLALAFLCSACGSSSPTAATPSPTPTPVPTPTPSSYTVAGTVTATNGGQALSGLSVDLNGQQATTNGAGGFTYALTSGNVARLALSGAGIVPRSLTLNVGSARTAAVGAIALSGGFDLAFYRVFVRNGFEAPTALEPVRHLTQAPRIYLRTIDEAGAPIDAVTLDTVAAALINTAGVLTGRYGLAGLERGTESREGMTGWLTVKWPTTTDACGRSFVGLDGGSIELNYKTPGCGCGASKMRPRTAKHELGHALGFWHTGDPNDLMSGLPVNECDRSPSAREIAHAAIAYARPVGNVDPDSDPTSAVNLAPRSVR